MADRTIIHIDLDAFFVSVEQAFNPALRGKPVVVGGWVGERGVVAAASYEARAFGLHSAMPLRTASRLCPQAIFIQGNFTRYREASAKFMAILADFSPFLEPGGLDEAYLDVTGFESLHGTIRKMAESIKRRIRDEIGINASIGIAPSKVVAKIASDYSKPDGLVQILQGREREFLAPLPVGHMPGVGQKAERVLASMDIRTIGQLADAPADMLKSRLGMYGEILRRHASGIDERKVYRSGTVKSISRETTFSRDIGSRPRLRATLRYLSEKVAADLRRKNKKARCVTLKLRFADFTTITRSRTLPQTIDGDQAVYQTGARLMEKALAAEKRPVRLLGIGVSGLSEGGGQLEMLDATDLRLSRLDRAIDRIRDKYGFTAIQTGRTLPLGKLFPREENGADADD